ncbi:TrkA C-terminal domain-containing protein [Gloeocapsopsis dulcis]|uniref:RCK C-terminal domain-containing protein n=1 Tax=Gloeocapsopsis dulcis AAB1 = 1H9 TaxID=1433147 RepID=A0A6N8FU93_9CHRO|nr:TrkA C-terminal domain-containing protein [Gloeocapsopsis dulcis]MUL36673.1 hypothetical protein [Gloeocapsopsis dulcis AAB1 = 1H9]WNN91248.1 TrkA C-terminal domain-containing protein [Gloeocapsopsis dulcis]
MKQSKYVVVFPSMTFVEPVLVGVIIQENSCYCGISLKNIQLPEKCICLGVVRDGEVILASAKEITLWCGDYVMAIAFSPAIVPALKVLLKKTHPISWSPFRSRLNWKHWLFQFLNNLSNLCCSKNCIQLH